MSIISDIFAGGAAGVFQGIGSLAKDVRIAITGKDPVAMAAAEAKLIDIESQAEQAQIAVNLEEAKNPNLFVSGWRPFIGWVCGFGFGYVSIFEPLGRFVATVCFKYTGAFPVIDTSLTMQVLLAMLGLGAMRTFEKTKDVAGKH